VIATGGGAILDAETRAWLRERGRVVYLRASIEQQLARTRHGTHRPLLNNADPRGTLERLMAGARAALTRRSPRSSPNTDGRKVNTVVEDVLRHMHGHETC
jgi:shikimate kinase